MFILHDGAKTHIRSFSTYRYVSISRRRPSSHSYESEPHLVTSVDALCRYVSPRRTVFHARLALAAEGRDARCRGANRTGFNGICHCQLQIVYKSLFFRTKMDEIVHRLSALDLDCAAAPVRDLHEENRRLRLMIRQLAKTLLDTQQLVRTLQERKQKIPNWIY